MVSRTQHAGQADGIEDVQGFGQGADDAAAGHVDADGQHGFLKFLAVFGPVDDGGVGPDHGHAVTGQHPVPDQVHRRVQGGLAAEGR